MHTIVLLSATNNQTIFDFCKQKLFSFNVFKRSNLKKFILFCNAL